MINIFKKTILLQIFLFLSLITLTIIEEGLLPSEEVPSDFSIVEGILFLFIFLLLPFMWYFLYKLKPIGKKLFVFYLILGAISFFVISDYFTTYSYVPLGQLCNRGFIWAGPGGPAPKKIKGRPSGSRPSSFAKKRLRI